MIYALLLCLICLPDCYANAVLPDLALPSHIADGSTVLLDCGRVYSGELNLEAKSAVTVKTSGNCGPATISLATPLSGWRRESSAYPIWSAAITIQPAQVEVGQRFMTLAHYPPSPQSWMTAASQHAGQLSLQLPNHDVVGATLVWRANDWLILAHPVLRYTSPHLTIASNVRDEFIFPPQTSFYIEGKCWMLTAAGEWCVEQGRLYVWAHDGGSPEGRTRVAPRGSAINANNSKSIYIQNIKIRMATVGVVANNAHHLFINNSEFEQLGEEAIIAGGEDIYLDKLRIKLTGLNGIRFTDDARKIVVRDSTIDGAGMLGMPKRSKGAIVLEQAQQSHIIGNTILNSAYIGIRTFRHSVVENNHIMRACLRLTDCGGIYTYARDGLPLNTEIRLNTISDIQGSLSYGIYLDDEANNVQVVGNTIEHNAGGMQLHNAHHNLIQGNLFNKNKNQQILFNETLMQPILRSNNISRNNFINDDAVPVYRLWSALGSQTIGNFASYSGNSYKVADKGFAELAGSGMRDWRGWRSRMRDTGNLYPQNK